MIFPVHLLIDVNRLSLFRGHSMGNSIIKMSKQSPNHAADLMI